MERSSSAMRASVLSIAVLGAFVVACGAAPAPKMQSDAPTNAGSGDERAVRARTELDDGEKSIEASTSECATACKALASMTRAQEALCEAAPKDCDAAKARVDKARAKVKGAGCVCAGSAP